MSVPESVFSSIFDFATDSTAVLFQDKSVVYRSSWVSLSRAAALEAGKKFVLLTPSGAALTLPLNTMLAQPGCQWLATMDDGRFFDGATGRVFTWDGEDFVSTDQLADDFLLTPPAPRGMVHVRAETVHPASLTARIGELTERVFRELTGSAPAGWGVHEPASEPWDIAALSAHCLSVAPRPSSLVVVGQPRPGTDAPAIATLSVDRLAAGVHEALEVLTEAVDPLDPSALDSFGAAMHQAHARTALLGHALGYSHLARPARFTGTSVPGCAVFGPSALSAFGAPEALAAAGPRARLVGVAPAQSLCVRYEQEHVPGSPHPLEEYLQLAQRLHDGD